MKKIESINVTHKELICLAIEALDWKIKNYEERAKGKGEAAAAIVREFNEPLKAKRKKIKELYLLETGVEYN